MTGRWPHPDPRRPKINHVEDWQRWVAMRAERAAQRPPRLTRTEYDALDPRNRADYDVARMISNSMLPHKQTPMGAEFAKSFSLQTNVNAMNGQPGVKMGTFMSGIAGGLGKSTLMQDLAAEFEDMVKGRPELFCPDDTARDRWVPVAIVPLPTNCTVKGLYGRILSFYGENVRVRSTSETELADTVREVVQDCGTLLVVIDDITRLNMTREKHQDTADAIRELQESGATVVGVGINIEDSGLMFERGRPLGGREEQLRTQTRRRFKLLPLQPFTYDSDEDIAAWAAHLSAVEQDILLLDHQPGDLSDICAESLFRSSTGFLLSLQARLTEACMLAVQTGVERLTPDILSQIVGDDAAEAHQAAEEQAQAAREDTAAGRRRTAPGSRPGDPGTRPVRRRKNGTWDGRNDKARAAG